MIEISYDYMTPTINEKVTVAARYSQYAAADEAARGSSLGALTACSIVTRRSRCRLSPSFG